ncbi:NADH dehydrogenase [ubiquinone] 1 alpha subcomplex assembly factor 4-like [Hyalella azteca]|uniref:NADH dehydrogenase [ubiquinone] 1 alpha subcomplex assembly factor 4-like n=1 Tax=Hyalella azteca TaxID=294128 RepID=A0A979FJT0_HYAAZ|nr:NADH dehydrogenase [ubiquinone] 1 alpha subcomplex assembly factor 4-like [Hyalella azteca]
MGTIVSRLRYRLTRPIREYNLQDRALQAVDRNKDIPSPRHPSTSNLIETSIQSLDEEMRNQLNNPDPRLASRLQKVYVTSQDVIPVQPVSSQAPERPLPLNRTPGRSPHDSFHNPDVVPYGKVKLKDVMAFLIKHQENPSEHNASSIARNYKLTAQQCVKFNVYLTSGQSKLSFYVLTEQVLKYFGTFRLMMPAETTKKQAETLKRLQATSDYFVNPGELPSTLRGLPELDKPPSKEEIKKEKVTRPVTQVQDSKQDTSHDVTLLQYKVNEEVLKIIKSADYREETKPIEIVRQPTKLGVEGMTLRSPHHGHRTDDKKSNDDSAK